MQVLFVCDGWMGHEHVCVYVCVRLCAASQTQGLFYIQTDHLVLTLGLWTGVRGGQQEGGGTDGDR